MKVKTLILSVGIALALASCANEASPLDYVDTRIGTQPWDGEQTLSGPELPSGFVYPGVGLPNAMMQLSPETCLADRCYVSNQPQILGFRASHYPNGASMSEYGAFAFMPTIGSYAVRPHERGSSWSKDSEVARPYYYSVDLEDSGIKAELTGKSSSGVLRFTYPESDCANIIIDNPRSEYDNYFRVIPEDNEVEGYVTNAGRVGNQGYTGREFACYFVVKVDKPFSCFEAIPEPEFADNHLLVPGGFKGEFYDGPDFEGTPKVVRTDADVDFKWESSPAVGIPADHFAVRYSGQLKARRSGKHVFYVISDDTVRLSVDGLTVIDSKKTRRPFPDLYSVVLEQGQTVDVVIEYTENTRDATLRFACLEPDQYSEQQLQDMAINGGRASGLKLTFPTTSGESVEVKVGTSFISFDQARCNLEQELGAKSFDAVAKAVRDEWSQTISRIHIETPDEDSKKIFYTAMQRVSLLPRNITEGGYHYSAFNGRVMPGVMYTDYSLWDTFRALHPLLVILYPDQVSEMIEGLLNSYDEGGWMPKWPSPGYSNIMTGTHADAVIADAYIKGIRGYDLDKALEAMMKDATVAAIGGQYRARVGIDDYQALGYVPTDRWSESCIRTMEFAYDDYCIAQVAQGMGRTDIYESMMDRSMNYLNVLDPETKLIRGRDSDGSWRDPHDTAVSMWSQGSDRDRETYYRNITFFVPHDVQGLINFMGGSQALEQQLDEFFDGDYYYVGDEFSMHSPYLYNYAGVPWKTQSTIRRLIRDNFKSDLGGLPGNEDCGQLSAWYIFGSLGFYPICPGSPVYVIGSPTFDRSVIDLPDGKHFTIEARGNSEANVYIQSAMLNGEPYSKSWFTHDDLMRGGTLVLEMGPEPNKGWGSADADLPPSVSKR